MKISLMLAILSLFAFRQSLGNELEAIAIYSAMKPSIALGNDVAKARPWEEYKNMRISIYLINRSDKEIRLPTSGLDVLEIGPARRIKRIEFCGIQQENNLGLAEVVPESSLDIVTLRKNETAVIRYQMSMEERNMNDVEIVYEIPGKFAARYKLWSGKLTMTARREGTAGLTGKP